MFRRMTMAIFRLYTKCLESSYTRLIMGCIQWGVGGKVGTRSRVIMIMISKKDIY